MAGKVVSGAVGWADLVVRGAPMAEDMLSDKLTKLSVSSRSRSQYDISTTISAKVAYELDAGGAGRYKDAKKRRQNPRRDDCFKGCMEADHIPPVNSWKRARHHTEFDSLEHVNPALYEMACSLENDRKGRNLPTIVVPKQCHRVNLTTGTSKISQSIRALLAKYIARGQAERMLKLAFIVAHPHASNKIRKDAGLAKKECEGIIEFSEERILKIYRRGFLELLKLYNQRGVINQEELERLTEFVENKRFLQRESDEYQEILGDVKKKNRRKQIKQTKINKQNSLEYRKP